MCDCKIFDDDWFFEIETERSTFFLLTCLIKTRISSNVRRRQTSLICGFSAAEIKFFDVEKGDVKNILDFDVKNRITLSFS